MSIDGQIGGDRRLAMRDQEQRQGEEVGRAGADGLSPHPSNTNDPAPKT